MTGRGFAIFVLLFVATLTFWLLRSVSLEIGLAAPPTVEDRSSEDVAPPPSPTPSHPSVPETETPEPEPPPSDPRPSDPPRPEPATPDPPVTQTDDPDIAELRSRRLAIPVEGIEADQLRDSFDEQRSGGRRHLALDIMAPRGTPVLAVEAGTVHMFENELGGKSLQLIDPAGVYCYYYAHLDAYAPDLKQGQSVERGQVLGTVGSTGNAADDAPHLHLAIHTRGGGFLCQGPEINPYLVFRDP